jgi:hypothetical protein
MGLGVASPFQHGYRIPEHLSPYVQDVPVVIYGITLGYRLHRLGVSL